MTVHEAKQPERTDTPLLLFRCVLAGGRVERWSSVDLSVNGEHYEARLIAHDSFHLRLLADDGMDGPPTLTVTLANADGHYAGIETLHAWRGALLDVTLAFFDLRTGALASEPLCVFRGMGNGVDEAGEASIRVSFTSRLSLQRVLLPSLRIQRRCAWSFPSTAAARARAAVVTVENRLEASTLCGYSADVTGGTGNLNGSAPFTSCGYTREDCVTRGMFDQDAASHPTRRFGGMGFVPAATLVRTAGERNWHLGTVTENEARFNDVVPLVYGKAWVTPPVVYARNDGNLTRMEVLLGSGEIGGVDTVLVNGYAVPPGQSGTSMTETGWYNTVTRGERTGTFNLDNRDGAGKPVGEPHGSVAVLSVVIPNRLAKGSDIPRVEVLMRGLRLPTFGTDGQFLGYRDTNSPAWVLLDLLQRSGWALSDLDLASFARVAATCAEATEPAGEPLSQCNLVLRRRQSAADVVRGVRAAAGVLLRLGVDGKVQAVHEGSLQQQQGTKPAGSNAIAALANGWPAFEFGDGTYGFSDLARRPDGGSSVRLWSRRTGQVPNRLSIEFQDANNAYQQDSVSLVDDEDVRQSGQEIAGTHPGQGPATQAEAWRALRRELRRGLHGNLFIEFQSGVRAAGLRPGDLISVTDLRHGLDRQPFRVIGLSLGLNHATARVTAQLHDDDWYGYDVPGQAEGSGRRSLHGPPRPITGELLVDGELRLRIAERPEVSTDGVVSLRLTVGFTVPSQRTAYVLGAPSVNQLPEVAPGGTLRPGQALYYALAHRDSEGKVGDLSSIVRAVIPATGSGYEVRLSGIRPVVSGVETLVYRGQEPEALRLLTTVANGAVEFVDTGLEETTTLPPDERYHHVNVWWCLEEWPEVACSGAANDQIRQTTVEWPVDELTGMTVLITRGRGRGQERVIRANTDQQITVATPWAETPDASSRFAVVRTGWQFGAAVSESPAEITVPNFRGQAVHIATVAADVMDQECSRALSPIERWTLGGAGRHGDTVIPPRPTFTLVRGARGLVQVTGIGFTSLAGTNGIHSGRATLLYWDEQAGSADARLGAAVGREEDRIRVTGPALAIDTWLQVASEVMRVQEQLGTGEYRVERASHGTVAVDHNFDSVVYRLSERIVPFVVPTGLIGSPAASSFVVSTELPSARLAAANLVFFNSLGASPEGQIAVTNTEDRGLRTYRGGQLTLQWEGALAASQDAVPLAVVDEPRVVRDLQAVLLQAPHGGDVSLRVTLNGEEFAAMAIPDGETESLSVSGFGLPPLNVGDRIGLDIIDVPTASIRSPGRNLTVVVRF